MTIEAGGTSLKFFSTTLPITDFFRTAIPPGKFQVFPVTDLTVLRPQGAPPPPSLAPASPPLPEPEPPPAIFHRPGTFPIAEDEMHLVQDLTRLTRRLCALPTAAPQELVGLAHALYALERLPQVTNGVSLEFSLGHRSGTEDSHTETDAWVHIEGSFFILGTTFRTYDTAVGGDHHSTIVFQVKSNGFRSTEPGDEAARLQVLDWINQFASLLDHHSPDELTLSVADASAPDFMPELDGE